jgi:hypothetical protein
VHWEAPWHWRLQLAAVQIAELWVVYMHAACRCIPAQPWMEAAGQVRIAVRGLWQLGAPERGWVLCTGGCSMQWHKLLSLKVVYMHAVLPCTCTAMHLHSPGWKQQVKSVLRRKGWEVGAPERGRVLCTGGCHGTGGCSTGGR